MLMHTHTLSQTHMGHGEVAVTVIGSCCRGRTHNSQLSVIIHHSSSRGLDASACVCVCVCHSGRDSQIASYMFQRTGKTEQKCGGGGEVWGGRTGICRVNIKGREEEIDDYIWQLERRWEHGEPQTSSELRADDRCLVTETCLMQQAESRSPQIEALSQHMTSTPSCMSSEGPSCDQVLKHYMTMSDITASVDILSPRQHSRAYILQYIRSDSQRCIAFINRGNLFKLARWELEKWTLPLYFLMDMCPPHSAFTIWVTVS